LLLGVEAGVVAVLLVAVALVVLGRVQDYL
jgi:hypothetical protein